MPDSKGLAHLRINAAGYGLNALFDIEDDTARAAAQSNHDAITDLAQQLAGDEADIVALQNKDAEIDATILQIDARDDGQDTQINALQDKTQLYSVVGGENVNHRVLQIGTGLEVNNNVLSVTGGGGGGGGDIDALEARVDALEANDTVQDGEISGLQTNVNTLRTVQTSQGNAITALQSSDISQNSDIADIKAALQSADLANMATRLTAVEVKNAQQDTAIANKSDVHVGAQGNTIPEVHLDGDQFTGDYQTGAVAINTTWLHNTIAGDTSVTGLATRVGDLETHDTVQDGQIQQLINSGMQYKTALRTQETQGGQTVDVNHSIVYVEGDLTIAEGTGNREILKLNPNGAAMLDISDLKTRMTTAEGDIDGLEANDVTLSMEKTGLYVNSGGTNSYYTDLALGSGLAVTNGVLDVVGGGGGGGAGYDIAATSDADSAATGWTYPATGASNFPAGVELGISPGTHRAPKTMLLTTDYNTGDSTHPEGKMQVCIYGSAIYTRQRSVDSNPSSATGYIWSDWVVSSYSTAKQTAYVDAATESGLYKPTATTSLPTGAGTDGVLFAQMVLTPSEFVYANVGKLAQIQQYTTASGIWIRTGVVGGYNPFTQQYGIQFGTWAAIGGGGSTGPTKIAAGTDLDTVTDAGEYYFNGGYMGNMPTWPGMVAPSSGEGNTPYFMTVRKRPYGGDNGTTYLIEQEIAATDNESQGFLTSTKNTIRHISRVKINNGSWSPWVSQDTAMTCADCNLACRTGKYWITNTTSNRPSGMGRDDIGIMEVAFEAGSMGYIVIQRITTDGKIYVRYNNTAGYNTQGDWGAWKSITLS